MKVSVIIPTYNRSKMLQWTLISFIEQLCEYNNLLIEKEAIVIDDGSTDNTEQICSDFCIRYPNIKYFRQANQGCAIACNEGIKKAIGDLICIMHDDDTFYGKHSLIKRAKIFSEYTSIDFVYSVPQDIIIDNLGKIVETPTKHASITTVKDIITDDVVYLTVLMWRKIIHDKIGYFNPLLLSNEDWEFEVKLFMECTPFFLNEKTVYYLRHSNNKSTINKERMKEFIQIFKNTIRKRYSRTIFGDNND